MAARQAGVLGRGRRARVRDIARLIWDTLGAARVIGATSQRPSDGESSPALPSRSEPTCQDGPLMTEDEFWALIELSLTNAAAARAEGNLGRPLRTIEANLRAGGQDVAAGFSHRMDQAMGEIFTHELWAVAYLALRGCSDDGFADFRSCVIADGRDDYLLASSDPISHGLKLDLDKSWCDCDRLQFVADRVYFELTGQSVPPGPAVKTLRGERWQESDLPIRCPDLWARWSDR